MFLKRLSAALVTIVCFGSLAVGANNFTQTDATNTEKETPLAAPLAYGIKLTNISPISCYGKSDGSITFTIVDGVGPSYEYRLDKDGVPSTFKTLVNNTLSNLSAGNYTLYVKDLGNAGATTSKDFPLSNPSEIKLNLTTSLTNPVCSGSLGSVVVSASNGAGGYTYYIDDLLSNYSDDNGTGNFSGLNSGSYELSVEDVNNCKASLNQAINISVLQPINFSYNILKQINCSNDYASVQFYNLPTDAFEIEVKNTTLNKVYAAHSSDYVYSNLEAGSYSVTVTRTSCPTTDKQTLPTFTIADFQDITVSTSPTSPVVLSCSGTLTPVSVTISGGKAGQQVFVKMDNNNGVDDDQQTTVNYGLPASFPDLISGNYTIRWNDVTNPSCSGTQSYIISNPSSPLTWMSDPLGIATKCYEGTDGSIQVNVSGGTSPYTYIIDGTEGPVSSLLNKSAGTYNVKIKDANDCETDDKTVTITQPDQLVVSHNALDDVNVKCPSGDNGEIHLTATGGSGNYKYDLISGGVTLRSGVPASSAIVIPNLAGGTYDVQVYEATNSSCTANPISNISITEPAPLSIVSFDLDTIQCDGDLANLSVEVTGGSSPSYSYKLYDGANLVEEFSAATSFANFSPLLPSSYTLKVWSDITCDSVSVPFSVVSRKKLVVTNVSDSIMVNCPSDIPVYTLTVSGEGGYSYSLDNGVKFVSFAGNSVVVNSGLIASANGEVNRFLIKDKYECTAEYSVTIYEPTPIQISDFVKTDNTCSNKTLGKISFNLSGGIPGYTIKLLDASTSAVIKTKTDNDGVNVNLTSIPGGKYTLDIKDNNGCPLTADLGEIEIASPDEFLIETPIYDPILCYNGTTDVQLSVIGGWAVDKTINVVGGTVDVDIAPGIIELHAGTYTLTATNTDGCRAKTKFTIGQPDSLILNSVVPKDVSCNNANDATITFAIKGGDGNYSYGLEGTGSAGTPFSGTPFTIESVEVGEYNLVVADGNLCSSNVVPVTIDEPDSVTFTFKTDSVSCFGLADGVITLTIKGGSELGFRPFLNGVEKTNPIRNLAAGSYEVRVEDSEGCQSKVENITVGEPNDILIISTIVSDSVSCNNVSDGSITIDASGGLPYALQYNAIGTTTNGTAIKRGYQNENLFEDLPGGEYTVYATIVKNGRNYCSTPSSKIVIVNPDPVKVDNIVLTNVTCHNDQDGKAVITAGGGTGGLVFSLIGEADNQANNTGVFTQLGHFGETSTTYNYSVVDQNTCTYKNSFTIINPNELTIDYLNHFQVRCNDEKNGWIQVKVDGGNSGYTFKKDIGEAITADIEAITANTYKIIKYDGGVFTPVVVDSKGCSDTLPAPVTIVNPDLLVIDNIEWGEKDCYGYMTDTTIIHVAGGTPGYFYSLDKGLTPYSSENDSIFIGEAVGNKYAVVKDSNGCVSAIEDVFLLTEPELFSVDYEFTGLKCYYDEHGDMKVDIQGGTGPYTFSFNDPTFAVDPLLISKSITSDVTSIKLSDQGIDLIPNVTYKFYLKDDNGCHVQNVTGLREFTEPFADTLFLTPEKIELKNIKPYDLKCQNQQTGVIAYNVTIGDVEHTISMPLGYTFTAYNKTHDYSKLSKPGEMSVNGLLEGEYELSLVDINGCKAATRMTGFNYEPENIYWGKDTTSINAEFDSIKVTVSEIVQPHCDYWFDGSIEVNIKNFRDQGVEYFVELYDSVESRWDQEYEDWSGSIPADPANMSDKTPGHELYNADKKKIAEEIGIGKYKITVRDVYSECTAEVIQDIFSIEGDSCPPIVYYNAFTPLNGDGNNDEWEILGSQYQSYTLQVFTAFGELVYSKKGISDKTGIKWDGIDLKGRPVPVGTYIYLLKKFEGMPNEILIDGNITILRANGR